MDFFIVMEKPYLKSNLLKRKLEKCRRRYFRYIVSIILISLCLVVIYVLKYSTYPLSESADLPNYKTLSMSTANINKEPVIFSNPYNQTKTNVYIDVGCFDGETIEHFIYFTPNSLSYDIITFEPDPNNFELCKQILSQDKYRNYNIIIIPKIVWIRNEKVLYQTKAGEKCRIKIDEKDKSNAETLDAIDFSQWLSQSIVLKNTNVEIKLSMPGREVQLLEKMLHDNTITIANKWMIEWSNRHEPSTLPARIFIQLMFDSCGYGLAFLIQLAEERKTFKMKGKFDEIPKSHQFPSPTETNWYAHYLQRPVVTDPPRTTRPRTKGTTKI